MNIDFNSSSEIPDKDSTSFQIGEGPSAAAPSSSGTDDSQRKFPNFIDAKVYVVVMEVFKKIIEGARLQAASIMLVPEGKLPDEGVKCHTITTHVDTFRILSKKGFYQKLIKALSESTEKEIEHERQEKRLKKYWSKIKESFLDFLKEVQEKLKT